MRRTLLLLSLIICFISTVRAQYNEVIYLKNGSIVKGKILEMRINEYVKFKTFDDNLWVFKYDDIEKFEMEKINEFHYKPDSLKQNYLQSDIGFMIGTVANEMKAPLSFLTSYNFQLTNSLFWETGTGLEFYQMTYIPVITGLRIAPLYSNFSIYFQGGLTFPINEKGTINQVEYKFKYGYLINPGISYTFRNTEKAEFVISLGYRFQKTDAERVTPDASSYYDPYNREYSIITKLNRFSLRLGYKFK
jgi:hypothetical protein